MTEEQSFLQKIIDNLSDDDTRFIFADWLEDHGQVERSEFIRIQIELAELVEVLQSDEACGQPLCDCEKLGPLRERERTLFGSGHVAQYLSCGGIMNVALYADDVAQSPVTLWGIVRRGFVSHVQCQLSDWIGVICPMCNGAGHFRRASRFDPCPGECRETGYTHGHGPEIVCCQPVERVTIVNKGPYLTGEGQWGFGRRERPEHNETWRLPPCIYDLLSDSDTIKPPVGLWDTEDRANNALSSACLKLAKQQARQDRMILEGNPDAKKPLGLLTFPTRSP